MTWESAFLTFYIILIGGFALGVLAFIPRAEPAVVSSDEDSDSSAEEPPKMD